MPEPHLRSGVEVVCALVLQGGLPLMRADGVVPQPLWCSERRCIRKHLGNGDVLKSPPGKNRGGNGLIRGKPPDDGLHFLVEAV